MKRLIPFFFAAFYATTTFAADPAVRKPAAAIGTDAGHAINTVCPASGDQVGSVGKPLYAEYHGQKIAFCCSDCAKKFSKNPDKYGALAEKHQSAHEPM